MATDVARFYGDVREGAFERFRANGSDKEIAYTICRNNDSGRLIAYFEVGTGASGWGPSAKPGGVAPTIDRPGLTPLLVGHIHDLPAGSCGLFCNSPRGASRVDVRSKAYYPRGTQFVLHQRVFDEWKDSCFSMMIDSAKSRRIRDRRLLISVALFVISFLSLACQSIILRLYINAAVMGDWTYFSRKFSVAPPHGPNQACFDYCASELPFMWGWIGIVSFAVGVGLVIYSWWKPRSPDHQ